MADTTVLPPETLKRTMSFDTARASFASMTRVQHYGYGRDTRIPDDDANGMLTYFGFPASKLELNTNVVKNNDDGLYWNRRDTTDISKIFVLPEIVYPHRHNGFAGVVTLEDGKRVLDECEVVNFTLMMGEESYYSKAWYCLIEVRKDNVSVPFKIKFGLAELLFNIAIETDEDNAYVAIAGTRHELPLPAILSNTTYRDDRYNRVAFDMTLKAVNELLNSAIAVRGVENVDRLIKFIVRKYSALENKANLSKKGIAKAYGVVGPLVDEIKHDHPMAYFAFQQFAQNCHRTVDSVKLSTVFNAEFKGVTTAKAALKKLAPVTPEVVAEVENGRYKGCPTTVAFDFEKFPSYKDKRRAAIKSNTSRAFNKLMAEYEFLSLDEKAYPRVTKAIKAGDIPIGTFFRNSKDQYFLFNDNWALWEEMLRKHYDVACEIAQEAARRTTYEKDIMSYFYFVLYALPNYLKRHTKKKWRCIPKVVNSPTELEPPRVEEGETVAKRRSALTPIVDNANSVVMVPYATLAMPGRQTTYCYGLTYGVLEKGMNFEGNVVLNEVEERLNGRDDYGLMFYTLTGSAQGRGYPTFLIIFERLEEETRVHFHRTHPCRSKQGDYNPIHNWIKVCYNWMAGNTPRSLIRYQQGDLVFVEDTKEGREYNEEPVDAYDHHVFESPVLFGNYSGKENILGYVKLNEDTVLNHSEHMSVPMKAGAYIIRQCRSWEANPAGVWSLRID